MEPVARTVAGAPRLLLRALVVCFFVALWLLLSDSAADAAGREDAPGLNVAESVRDTAASGREAVRHPGGSAVEPVDDAEETGRRTAEATVDGVEDVIGRTADTVDQTTEQMRSTVEETARQVTEVAEVPRPVPGPRPAPAPVPDPDVSGGNDAGVSGRSVSLVESHRSLAAQEDPGLLVVPATHPVDLVAAASAVARSTTGDVLANPAPAPTAARGVTSGDAAPAHGSSGQPLPTPAQAAHLGSVAAPASGLLVGSAFERALIPPADRATSPGTTPD